MTSIVVAAAARVMFAPILVVALAVLVKGFVDVGDGFSAGVIAALGVLLQYVAVGREEVERTLPVRHLPRAALGGLLIALGLTFVPAALGDPILTHRPPAGAEVTELGTLELMTAVAFDAAVFVLVLGVVVGVIHTVARLREEGER